MTYLQYVVENLCPAEKLGNGFPNMDSSSYVTPLLGAAARGCRGITCEQCWNQDVMKPLDK